MALGVTFSPPVPTACLKTLPREPQLAESPWPARTHRPEDDPLAVAVLQGAPQLGGQLLLIDVGQQVTHRAQHHHLHTHTEGTALTWAPHSCPPHTSSMDPKLEFALQLVLEQGFLLTLMASHSFYFVYLTIAASHRVPFYFHAQASVFK